jgi:hypothetical protein
LIFHSACKVRILTHHKRKGGLTWIPPASSAEQLIDVSVESHVHVRENEGDLACGKIKTVNLFDNKWYH